MPASARPADPAASSSGALPAEDFIQSGESEGLRPEEAAALDDPDEMARYVTVPDAGPDAGIATGRLRVDGMHCAACAVLIEQALRSVDGVVDAQVNGAARRAVVRWEAGRARPSELVAAVHGAGYLAFPDTGSVTPQGHGAAERERFESKRATWRLFVAGFCMMQVMMYAAPLYFNSRAEIGADVVRLLFWASWLLSLPVVLFAATPFYKGAWVALKQRRIGMDVPVALGVIVTFVVSTAVAFDPRALGDVPTASLWGNEVYFDSLTMFVTFLLAGRLLEQRARQRAALALDSALNRLPSAVERIESSGPEADAPEAGDHGAAHAAGPRSAWIVPSKLRVGDHVRIAAGQAFVADGAVIEGRTEVDESLLSGESRPLARAAGDAVLAGSINLSHPVVMRIDRLGADTRYERIVKLMQRAVDDRPAVVLMADRLAAPFLWVVLLLAGAGALAWSFIEPARAVWVAVAVLIVTCPCALSLAAPSAMLAAAGALARRGVLVQRFDAFEALAGADVVVFDKTGTLTDERPRVTGMRAPADADTAALRARAVSLAAHSRHPLSQALVRSLSASATVRDAVGALAWREVREWAGKGVEGLDADGTVWRLGSAAWAAAGREAEVGTLGGAEGEQAPRVWLAAAAGAAVAYPAEPAPLCGFQVDEALRPDAAQAVRDLRAAGAEVMILSGDDGERVRAIAERVGATSHRAQAAPQDKLDAVAAMQEAGRRVAVVGDGINDAPVLARAHTSFAMGHGAALAQARADFIVLGSRPGDVMYTLDLSRRALKVVRQNLSWAVAYNVVSLPLALVGWLPPWLAGLGMAGSSLLVVLNAVRLGRDRGEASGLPVAATGPAPADATSQAQAKAHTRSAALR